MNITFEAIGTTWQIDLYGLNHEKRRRVEEGILIFLHNFEKIYSRFRDDSLITKISQNSGIFQFPEDAGEIFSLYKKLYDLSGGKFTPLIGNLLSDAGYDRTYSFQEKSLRKVPLWEDSLKYQKGNLHTKKAVLLDFGAIGKGYAMDRIGEILDDHDTTYYIIDAGGDLLIKQPKNASIGLENPLNSKEVIGVARISEGSICASSGSRRKWGKYHHIMDPIKKNSVNSILATWVISDTSTIADALATCLFLTSPDNLKNDFIFEYGILYPDFRIEKSKNFPGEFFII